MKTTDNKFAEILRTQVSLKMHGAVLCHILYALIDKHREMEKMVKLKKLSNVATEDDEIAAAANEVVMVEVTRILLDEFGEEFVESIFKSPEVDGPIKFSHLN